MVAERTSEARGGPSEKVKTSKMEMVGGEAGGRDLKGRSGRIGKAKTERLRTEEVCEIAAERRRIEKARGSLSELVI